MCITVFPHLFLHINNTIDSMKVKSILMLKEKKDSKVNIYSDKANIIIMFDDGWKSQYTVAYKYMNQRNIVGSVSVIPKMVNEMYYMNKSDLYTLYDSNWDILNHTYSHKNLNKISKKEQVSEIVKADKWLDKNGFINSNKVLIYPEGDYNSDTVRIMKKLNYTSGRSVVEGFNNKKIFKPYSNKVKNILTHTNPKDVCSWIDYAIDHNLTLILLFHRLESDTSGSLMKYKKEHFYKIIDYIDERRDDLNIITYSDWLLVN